MKTILFILALLSPFAHASEINCGGQITMVMAEHPSCQSGMAFKTTMSADKWMCTKSEEAGSVVLTALTTEKVTYVGIDNNNAATCPDLPNYREINIVIIYA